MTDDLRQNALDYHRYPTPGKLSITPTKDMATARDLALAYSPGVAVPCEEIAADPSKAYDYTAKGNLVAVISNGTAVLGLGNIGALAGKPVMEGKAVLFKKFAGIDSIDIEITPTDVDEVVNVIAAMEPTFGGINLEDFKAPECFEIERRLKERMKIPVFHDDQHGTAIVVAAAVINWAFLTKRDLGKVKLVSSGAGASALAVLDMLVSVGLKKENIVITDREGVVFEGRNVGMDPYKIKFAAKTKARNLTEALAENIDVFLGLSAAGALKADMIKNLNKDPLILALANPTPEIMPFEVAAVRPDAYMATGRSDFANQVNNVLCFPFIFRGALDVGATGINEEMKTACAHAIAELARQETSVMAESYGAENLTFGKEYLIPKPFDPRLITLVPMAVAKAAMESGVATRPIANWKTYQEKLDSIVNQTTMVMRPVIQLAQKEMRRVIFAEGEEHNILRAVQMVVDEKIAYPVLVGRESVIEKRISRLSLRMKKGVDFDLVDPENDTRYAEYAAGYFDIMARQGMTPADAKSVMRTNNTVIAGMLLEKNVGDAMICGVVRKYHYHLQHLRHIIGLRDDVMTPAALFMLMLPNRGPLFICDTHVNYDPNSRELAEITVMAAEQVRRFGIEPKIALLSHSNFGSHNNPSARKMREVQQFLARLAPDLAVEGEMHADAALSPEIRDIIFPQSNLKGAANLLVMPNLDAANIGYNLLKIVAEGVPVGPMLLGMKKPVHIVTNAVRVRGLVNMTAYAAASANMHDERKEAF